jgi:hypothetical protein
MEARSTPALPTPLIPTKNNVLIFFDMTAFSWKIAGANAFWRWSFGYRGSQTVAVCQDPACPCFLR